MPQKLLRHSLHWRKVIQGDVYLRCLSLEMNCVYDGLKCCMNRENKKINITGRSVQTRSLCGHSLAEQHYFIIPIRSKIVIKSEHYLREHSRGEDFATSHR